MRVEMRNFNKDFYSNIGKRVREAREEKHLSREKLSQLAGISDKFLYDIEVGNKGISAETLFCICEALEISADWLLKGK